MQKTNWCFTINNPQVQDLLCIQTNLPKIKYLIANLEKGENQTPHYQGYLELTRSQRLQTVRLILPRAHLEPRGGTRQQAIQYCLKDLDLQQQCLRDQILINSTTDIQDCPSTIMCTSEKLPESFELSLLIPTSTKTTRAVNLLQMKKMIEEGKTDKDLAEFSFSTYVSCYRALNYYRLICSVPRTKKTKVLVLQGPTGTGKSHWAMETFPDSYWKQRSQWWDGYTNQKHVIIDEFYGWLPFDLCLRLCDRYPLHVETKGGNVNFIAETIIFTTNNLPSSWWKNSYFQSFIRRVDEWHIFPLYQVHFIYKTYEEALPHFFTN